MGIAEGHAHTGQSFEVRGMDLSGIPTQRTGPVIHVIHRDKKNARFGRRVGDWRQKKKKQGESNHWVSNSIVKQLGNAGILIKNEKASSAPPNRQGKADRPSPFPFRTELAS